MSQPSAVAEQSSNYRWVICALLFLATTINYMDRQILGILAPVLEKEIGWDERQYSNIVVAFQIAYAIGLITSGYLVDRWGVRKGFTVAAAIWSVAACLHAAARNVAQFAMMRFLLGVGESGNFPTSIKATAEWFPKSQRALATGIFNSGSNVGAIVAPAVVPWIATSYGWRAAFVVIGACGFAWTVLWLLVYRPVANRATRIESLEPAVPPNVQETPMPIDPMPRRVGWLELLTIRQTWAFIVISFPGAPVGWFFLYWLPKYFSDRYHLSLEGLGPPLIFVYSMAFIGSITGGLITPAFLRAGFSLHVSRKLALLICAVLMLPVCFVTMAPDARTASLMIGITAAALQGWAANHYTVASDLFPRSTVATVVGIGSACGSIASIVYAKFAGSVLAESDNYGLLFVVAGIACPLGLAAMHLLSPRGEPAQVVGVSGHE